MMLRRLFNFGAKNDTLQKQIIIERNLLRREAKIGGALFGPMPKGFQREFFCLDESTWVWHEEWENDSGEKKVRTTRYDIRPSGIYKAQEGRGYRLVEEDEAQRLLQATELYQQKVSRELYHQSVEAL